MEYFSKGSRNGEVTLAGVNPISDAPRITVNVSADTTWVTSDMRRVSPPSGVMAQGLRSSRLYSAEKSWKI